MIVDMPRPRPPHLHSEPSRHGQTRWYVRVGKGPRIRIREAYGTPEFDEAYQAALSGAPRQRGHKAAVGSLRWLYERYRDSGAWMELSPATKRQRENIFKHVMESAGDDPARLVTAKTIKAGIERRSKTPAQARNFLQAMRGMFEWSTAAEHTAVDPTAGIKGPPRKRGPGFKAWTEADVAAYQARWPLGTRQRVWLDVLLYSGLRRGDVTRYGRQHVRNGIGRMKLEKGGELIEVTLPVLPILKATLEAGPIGDLTFICGERGRPLTKESFGNMFKEAVVAAGIPDKSAHGVRKIAATTAANNGATTEQLKALFGWIDDAMPALYVKTANRERLAKAAGHLIANEERTSIPAPSCQVRAGKEK